MNNTTIDTIKEKIQWICEGGVQLLSEFSGVHPITSPDDPFIFISVSGNYAWNSLPPAGKQVQIHLLKEINGFVELVRSLTRTMPEAGREKLLHLLEDIRAAVEQDTLTWWKTKNEAIAGFQKLTDQVVAVIVEHYGSPLHTVLAIPDTNALLINPDIEHWYFEGVDHFEFILTPALLSELDKHKINHKNPDIREKAHKLIRKFKEYRRRGPLHQSIVVVNGRISLRSIACEPNMSQALSWFDPTNTDDRFLATALEIMADNLAASVFIVTSDINMQNKAEMALIPFQETPESEQKDK